MKRDYTKLTRRIDVDEVVAKFKAGASKTSLRAEYQCSVHTIDRILLRAGAITYDHPRSDKILSLRRGGMTRNDIARKLKTSPVVVGKVIRAEKNTRPSG